MPEDETLASPEAVDELSMSVGISKEALKKKNLGVCWVAFGFNLMDKRRGKFQVHLSWMQIPIPPDTKEKIKGKKHRKGQKKVPIFLGFRSQLAAALAKICSATGQSSAFFNFLFPISLFLLPT